MMAALHAWDANRTNMEDIVNFMGYDLCNLSLTDCSISHCFWYRIQCGSYGLMGIVYNYY